MERAPLAKGDPVQLKALGEEIYKVTYGTGFTAQERENFLIQYGCTGWNPEVLQTILELCESRGIVEIGAGHGQWARAITEAYLAKQKEHETVYASDNHSTTSATNTSRRRGRGKHFDFVLAYDDFSNLPLNTHIYNAYTQPHHDHFGNVQKLETKNDMLKVLRSWACRGRVLLLVYPPPGDMAMDVVQTYVDAAETGENDTIIFVGEGRGGANGNDALFDYFESGDWILLKEMDVHRPPGDKGYEKLYILQKRHDV